jgi:mannose-1-phosphate guanylyltransferase
MGAGITVDLQESEGRNTTPAAAAAESLINSRLESLVLLLIDVMAEKL